MKQINAQRTDTTCACSWHYKCVRQAEVCYRSMCTWFSFHQTGNPHHLDSRSWNNQSAAVPSTHLQHKACLTTRWKASEMNRTRNNLSWQCCQVLEPVHRLNHISSIPRKHHQWWNIFFGWLIIAKILLRQHNQHFYLDVSVSIRDHQKKFVQFLFRFLPR